jgi:cytoplasmic iron level regulating protein YaaA (DUF328/UPF0246 family)
MSSTPTATPREVIEGWFGSAAFSHCPTREDAAQQVIDLLADNGYLVVQKPKRAIRLTFHERNAGIRAYNSLARAKLHRGQMVDAIIDAINDERIG